MATFLNASVTQGFALRLAFDKYDPTAMPTGPAPDPAGGEGLGWVRPKGQISTVGCLYDETGRVVISGWDGPPHVHQFVALYDQNYSEPHSIALAPGSNPPQAIYPMTPSNNARLKPDADNALRPFWAARMHYQDWLSVDPVAKAVTWKKKTFSQDEIDQYNWMMENVPGIDKKITVADLEAHSVGLRPGGASLSFGDGSAPGSAKRGRSADPNADKKTLAITNLVFDSVICLIGLGPLIKIEGRSFEAIGRAAVEDAFAYTEWAEGEGSASAIERWAEAESSGLSELRANWPNASMLERYNMISGIVLSIGLLPIKKIVTAALSGLGWKDYLLFGSIALAELVSFFTPAGVVTAAIGVLEFAVMLDIIVTDVMALREAYHEAPPKPGQ